MQKKPKIIREIAEPFDITKGVIEEFRSTDYVAGIASPIGFEDRKPDSNWDKYLPADNSQYLSIKTDSNNNTILYVDYFACVTYSGCSDVETQLNWLYQTNLMLQDAKDFFSMHGYIEGGKFRLSNRFTAIMSGTTIQGNSLQNVADSLRKDGILPHSMFPDPTKEYFYDIPNNQDTFTIDARRKYLDRKYVTDAMIAMAKESTKYFSLNYEWVVAPNDGMSIEEKRANILKSLRHAPLQLAKDGHATDYYLAVDKQKLGQYDSYSPYKKDRPWDYDAPWVMKIVVGNKSTYTLGEVMDAQKRVTQMMKGRLTSYFFRSEVNGEAYLVSPDGSFKYKKGLPCPLFTSMCADKTITPVGETDFSKIKAAEIK